MFMFSLLVMSWIINAILLVLVVYPRIALLSHIKKGHVRCIIDNGNNIEYVWCNKIESFLFSIAKNDKRVWIINKKTDIKTNPKTKTSECFVLENKPMTIDVKDAHILELIENAGYTNIVDVQKEFIQISEDEEKITGVRTQIMVEGETITLPQIENLIRGYTPKALWSYIKTESTNIALMTQPKDAAKTFLMMFLGVLLAIIIGYVIIKSNVVINPQTIVDTAKNITIKA